MSVCLYILNSYSEIRQDDEPLYPEVSPSDRSKEVKMSGGRGLGSGTNYKKGVQMSICLYILNFYLEIQRLQDV